MLILDALLRCSFGLICWMTLSAFQSEAPCPPYKQLDDTPIDQHLVYFPHDSSVIPSCPWYKVVLEDIARLSSKSSAAIEVRAHTDRSGTTRYNQRLSRMRGENVREELVNLGVPTSKITVNPLGETELPVATDDGVKQQLNRFVLIRLPFPD